MKQTPIASIVILTFLCVILTAFSFNKQIKPTDTAGIRYAWSDHESTVDTSYIDYQKSISSHGYSKEEVELLALLTIAEAEGEGEYGQRLVIDTVLNRVDHPNFPDTIYDVIYQPYHFESVWNGRMDRCKITTAMLDLVQEEMTNRSNRKVIFFQTKTYSQYGSPLLKVGNHYFSEY